MSDNPLVNAWKNPTARAGAAAAHPAGSIRLGTGAVVGRRAQLLAGLASTGEDPDHFPTYSLTLTSWGDTGGY
ncbi:hypothetical protein RVR_9496 [Actinacidiphila reveromycinica]|uniref:Uncharacterized protein n=1 Tax=Actinacidiphila reveromycinica TaxID=659352 RepID=A0A7U3V035_9ACTN|nr:hypothetical protein [Streptomyces sp. SN-593]BBB01880.1 hypothetical protein RVR_9496 [Streptomyces sp. SN-593]